MAREHGDDDISDDVSAEEKDNHDIDGVEYAVNTAVNVKPDVASHNQVPQQQVDPVCKTLIMILQHQRDQNLLMSIVRGRTYIELNHDMDFINSHSCVK